MFFLCGTFLFLSISSALAITTSGSLTEDEIWSGTVNLTGDVTIPVGITLTIEAGTTAIFPARSDDRSGGEDSNVMELIINGSLLPIGSADNKITSGSGGSIPNSDDWGGIKCNAGLGVKTFDLEYCTTGYASTGVKWHVNGGIQSGTSITGSFSNNPVSDCSFFGIVLVVYDSATGNVDVNGSKVTDPTHAIYVYTNSHASSKGIISKAAKTHPSLTSKDAQDAKIGFVFS